MARRIRNDYGHGLQACKTLIERGARFVEDMGGACMVMDAPDSADIGITQSTEDVLDAYRLLLQSEEARFHAFRDAVVAARGWPWHDQRDEAIDDALMDIGVEVDHG